MGSSNHWGAAQGQMVPGPNQSQFGGGGSEALPVAMDVSDWRTQLPADARQRIVNKILDIFTRHVPFTGQEGMQELKKIAIRVEEEIYNAATSRSDYLRKLSMKMLQIETTKSQNPMANSTALQDQVAPGSTQSQFSSGGAVSGLSAVTNIAPPTVVDGNDWRIHLQVDTRLRVVNKILETLTKHLPFSGQEGMLELKKIAIRFEEKIYTAATSQDEYLRKISMKMLTMECKSQNPVKTLPDPVAEIEQCFASLELDRIEEENVRLIKGV